MKLNFFQTLSSRVGQDFDVEIQQDFETGVVQHFAADVCKGYEFESWLRF